MLGELESFRNYKGKERKIAHEWNSHLKILNCSQAIENSRQHLLLRTDILQKTVVGSGSFRGLYRPKFSTQRHSLYNRKVRHVKHIMGAPNRVVVAGFWSF